MKMFKKRYQSVAEVMTTFQILIDDLNFLTENKKNEIKQHEETITKALENKNLAEAEVNKAQRVINKINNIME